MGSESGGGLTQGPGSFHDFLSNIERRARKYPLDSENRLGTKVDEARSELLTNSPLSTAEDFWRVLSHGGRVESFTTPYGPGSMATFADGSHVVWRPITKTSVKFGQDSPSIEIAVKTSGFGLPARYQIHFKKGSHT